MDRKARSESSKGPNTQGVRVNRLDVDPIHDEIFVADPDKIRVFQREANGDVAPIRIIRGPDTQLKNVQSIAVDPINNIIAVGLNSQFGSRVRPG